MRKALRRDQDVLLTSLSGGGHEFGLMAAGMAAMQVRGWRRQVGARPGDCPMWLPLLCVKVVQAGDCWCRDPELCTPAARFSLVVLAASIARRMPALGEVVAVASNDAPFCEQLAPVGVHVLLSRERCALPWQPASLERTTCTPKGVSSLPKWASFGAIEIASSPPECAPPLRRPELIATCGRRGVLGLCASGHLPTQPSHARKAASPPPSSQADLALSNPSQTYLLE
jgi:hypothetical protein